MNSIRFTPVGENVQVTVPVLEGEEVQVRFSNTGDYAYGKVLKIFLDPDNSLLFYFVQINDDNLYGIFTTNDLVAKIPNTPSKNLKVFPDHCLGLTISFQETPAKLLAVIPQENGAANYLVIKDDLGVYRILISQMHRMFEDGVEKFVLKTKPYAVHD